MAPGAWPAGYDTAAIAAYASSYAQYAAYYAAYYGQPPPAPPPPGPAPSVEPAGATATASVKEADKDPLALPGASHDRDYSAVPPPPSLISPSTSRHRADQSDDPGAWKRRAVESPSAPSVPYSGMVMPAYS